MASGKWKKTNMIIVIVSICAIVLFLCAFCEIYKVYNITKIVQIGDPESLVDESVDSLELTRKEYVDDFEFLWKVVTEGMPIIEDYKTELNYDFKSNYNRYYNEIAKSQDDFEFLCKIKSVLNDIPSFHTCFKTERYYEYFYANCYMSNLLAADIKLPTMQKLWFQCCEENIKEYAKLSDSFVFSYIDGEYVFSAVYSQNDKYAENTVSKIDGKDIECFVKNTMSAYPLWYDFHKEKFYRPIIVFNEKTGERHELTLKDKNGMEKKEYIYYDIQFEYSMAYYDYYISDNVISNHYEVEKIEDNIIYCSVYDFSNNDGRELWKTLKEYCFMDDCNVILDLRGNNGGYIEYALSNIVTVLFSGNHTLKTDEWLYKSDSIKELSNTFSFYGILERSQNELKNSKEKNFDYLNYKNNFFIRNNEYKYNGLNTYSPKVYVLTSKTTGSAADNFVAGVREYPETTIIGDNTGGEMNGGHVIKSLPNSKLVFDFFPEIYFNKDGTNNSIYGTSPDVYSVLTKQGFFIKEQMLLNNIDAYSIDNRIKWDDTLLSAMNLIESDN